MRYDLIIRNLKHLLGISWRYTSYPSG